MFGITAMTAMSYPFYTIYDCTHITIYCRMPDNSNSRLFGIVDEWTQTVLSAENIGGVTPPPPVSATRPVGMYLACLIFYYVGTY